MARDLNVNPKAVYNLWKRLIRRNSFKRRPGQDFPALINCTHDNAFIPEVGVKSIVIDRWTTKTFWGDRLYSTQLNSVAQQSIMANAYCAHLSNSRAIGEGPSRNVADQWTLNFFYLTEPLKLEGAFMEPLEQAWRTNGTRAIDEKLTVWCTLWAGGIIGPYFIKNDEGHNVTVNGDRYRVMITNFIIPELNNHDVQELWFQQDGATCHTARATIDLLKDTLGDRLISRFGPVNWPPRSCDLTPLDYFLWGYVKSLVYADKPQTLDHLEDNIRRVIADIRPQMLEKVIENWTSRLDYIGASRGSPMPEIIFKM
ncbi:putative transposable element [Trichonephila clavipes]|nr:putative transposable element [Trichonephila clavipes]